MAKKISVYPKTYSGYDKDGNLKITRTAEDATKYINPDEVKTAIEAIKETVNAGLKNIAKAIENIKCGEDTLVVADKTMQPIINELASQIAGQDRDEDDAIAPLANQMEEALEEVHECACNACDDIQQKLNSQAESACWVVGVTNVR